MSWNVFVYDWAHAPGSTFDLLFLPWLILAIPGFVWMVHAAYPTVGLAVAALRVPYFVTIAIFYDPKNGCCRSCLKTEVAQDQGYDP